MWATKLLNERKVDRKWRRETIEDASQLIMKERLISDLGLSRNFRRFTVFSTVFACTPPKENKTALCMPSKQVNQTWFAAVIYWPTTSITTRQIIRYNQLSSTPFTFLSFAGFPRLVSLIGWPNKKKEKRRTFADGTSLSAKGKRS